MPMTEPKYRSAPIPSTSMPPGIPYIVGNEAAERFSFYGMKAILMIFMTQYLLGANGRLATMEESEGKAYLHLFVASAYFFPVLGAILSDALWGKYRTILSLSLVYCLGHLALAVDETRLGLFSGLILIAIGAGGIKSCVSAHVGDQFGATNQHLLEKVFRWFYFAINLGAAASTILTPELLDRFGPRVAFGVPGALMLLATFVFWLGRWKFIHVPAGGRKFFAESFSAEGMSALGKLCIIYVFIAMFWCVFDQTGSAWVLQAEKMDRHWLGVDWLSSQPQAFNAILILIFIPLFAFVVYPAMNRFFNMTPLRKISIGLFLAFAAACMPALIEMKIAAGPQSEVVEHAFGKLDADGDGKVTLEEEFLLDDEREDAAARQLFTELDADDDKILTRSEIDAIAAAVPVWLYDELGPEPGKPRLDQAFDAWDSDDEEGVSSEEILAAWSLHRENVEKSFRDKYDEDDDGSLSADEMPRDLWERSFFKLDENGDGNLMLDEFRFGGDSPDAAVERLYGRLNTDGDESVTLAEFRLAEMPNIVWQFVGYLLLTAAEIMISITGLEFSYTQAPKKAKSLVMGLFLLAVSGGNLFTAGVNYFNANPNGTTKMNDVQYFWFFAALMLAAAVVFIGVAAKYRERTYIQDEEA